MNDGIVLDLGDSEKKESDSNGILLDIDLNDKDKEEQNEDSSNEENSSEPNEPKDEDSNSEGSDDTLSTDDKISELDALLSEISDIEEDVDSATKAVEESGDNSPQVKELLVQIKKLQEKNEELESLRLDTDTKLRNLLKEKGDLTYKNAELEAFGVSEEPEIMIISKNFKAAKSGDKDAQGKIKRIIQKMYSDIYSGDIEKDVKDESIDAISSIETYHSMKGNPNIKEQKDNDVGIVM